MKLGELGLDPESIVALDIQELGIRILPWIASMPPSNRQLGLGLDEVEQNYQMPVRSAVATAIREAWAWLEGQALLIEHPGYHSPNALRILSRRASQLVESARALPLPILQLPKEALHQSIREDVWALYHRGKFDTAVFEAFKAVEVHVRSKSKLSVRDLGVPLMRRAFDKTSGPLRDPATDEGEREARAHLFAGAIGSFKNPQSHRKVELSDPQEAFEIIMVANHLLRVLDDIESV